LENKLRAGSDIPVVSRFLTWAAGEPLSLSWVGSFLYCGSCTQSVFRVLFCWNDCRPPFGSYLSSRLAVTGTDHESHFRVCESL
jgi:hypothetical protein